MDSCVARANTGFDRLGVCMHSSAGQEADPALTPHGTFRGHSHPTTKIPVGSSNPFTPLKPHTPPYAKWAAMVQPALPSSTERQLVHDCGFWFFDYYFFQRRQNNRKISGHRAACSGHSLSAEHNLMTFAK